MGLFKKRSDQPDMMEQMRLEIAAMNLRLDGADTTGQSLDKKVQGLETKLEQPVRTTPPLTPPIQAATMVDFDALNSQLRKISERLAEVDMRITSISTELTNQITELSGDIESLGGNEPTSEETIDQLRDAQTRLANEQARYQIAFRQDIADVANRLNPS